MAAHSYAVADVHGLMGSDQKSFIILIVCRSLANGYLFRVSCRLGQKLFRPLVFIIILPFQVSFYINNNCITFTVEVPDSGEEVTVFQEAYKKGIHRTVHAGETGPAEMVRRVSDLNKTF